MINLFFELDRLRASLESKGLDKRTVDDIVDKARRDIQVAFEQAGKDAMLAAIEVGVAKRSSSFINELMLDGNTLELTTQSSNLNFSEPPFPMLPKLLKGGKPLKDGSGVYKVIPVGTPGDNRPKVSTNIYDAWKQNNARQAEVAAERIKKSAPKGSKATFRTATSKQDPTKNWVMPAQEKDFTEEVKVINVDLEHKMAEIIAGIIREYEEGF